MLVPVFFFRVCFLYLYMLYIHTSSWHMPYWLTLSSYCCFPTCLWPWVILKQKRSLRSIYCSWREFKKEPQRPKTVFSSPSRTWQKKKNPHGSFHLSEARGCQGNQVVFFFLLQVWKRKNSAFKCTCANNMEEMVDLARALKFSWRRRESMSLQGNTNNVYLASQQQKHGPLKSSSHPKSLWLQAIH